MLSFIDRLLRRRYDDQIRTKTVEVYVDRTSPPLVGRALDLTHIPDHLPARPGNEVTERWLIVGEDRSAWEERETEVSRWKRMLRGSNMPATKLIVESMPGLRGRFWEARWAARIYLTAWGDKLRRLLKRR